jgi:hypothetical protein
VNTARRALVAGCALLPLLAAACVENRPPAPAPAPESLAAATIRRERAYLLEPLAGLA